MVLDFENIHVQYGRNEILHGVDLSVEKGKITGIIGPNGCGKSTLVKTVFGIAPMKEGKIFLEGTDAGKMTRKELAEKLGYVGQDTACVFDFTVEDIIGMALYNKKREKASSKEIIRHAMEELKITDFSGRNIQTLSGGERKMVFLARAVAQGVDTIILDEPTNHLDIRHQLFLLNYLKQSGKTILIVIHDLRLASYYCDTLYLMKEGRVLSHGTPREVLTREQVEKVFGISGYMVEREDGEADFAIDFEKRIENGKTKES